MLNAANPTPHPSLPLLKGEGEKPKSGARQTSLKRLGLNASKPQSKMALSEWFETYGSKPEAKVPPKRRHFAVENRCN